MNEIHLLSLSQKRACMMDRKNKGGRSLVLRCSTKVRGKADCPFYCKLRLSGRDHMWYICTGFHGTHDCAMSRIPPRFDDVQKLLLLRSNGQNL